MAKKKKKGLPILGAPLKPGESKADAAERVAGEVASTVNEHAPVTKAPMGALRATEKDATTGAQGYEKDYGTLHSIMEREKARRERATRGEVY